MTKAEIYKAIKDAHSKAPKREKTAELHLQFIKYASELKNEERLAICQEIGIGKSYKTEIGKMRNIIDRLKGAGLDTSKI